MIVPTSCAVTGLAVHFQLNRLGGEAGHMRIFGHAIGLLDAQGALVGQGGSRHVGKREAALAARRHSAASAGQRDLMRLAPEELCRHFVDESFQLLRGLVGGLPGDMCHAAATRSRVGLEGVRAGDLDAYLLDRH